MIGWLDALNGPIIVHHTKVCLIVFVRLTNIWWCVCIIQDLYHQPSLPPVLKPPLHMTNAAAERLVFKCYNYLATLFKIHSTLAFVVTSTIQIMSRVHQPKSRALAARVERATRKKRNCSRLARRTRRRSLKWVKVQHQSSLACQVALTSDTRRLTA